MSTECNYWTCWSYDVNIIYHFDPISLWPHIPNKLDDPLLYPHNVDRLLDLELLSVAMMYDLDLPAPLCRHVEPHCTVTQIWGVLWRSAGVIWSQSHIPRHTTLLAKSLKNTQVAMKKRTSYKHVIVNKCFSKYIQSCIFNYILVLQDK